jgi:DNA-directed RNA polymerase subunit omega
MARITVEDCVTVVPNRFELCLIASNRAKSILSGAPTTLDRNEKPAVVALREIAEHLIDIDAVKRSITRTIRNRGLIEVVGVGEEVVESIQEEAESNIELKDNTFVSENIQVDD